MKLVKTSHVSIVENTDRSITVFPDSKVVRKWKDGADYYLTEEGTEIKVDKKDLYINGILVATTNITIKEEM